MTTVAPPSSRARFIIHPFLDFWLMGGASIAIWFILKFATEFRSESFVVEQRFLQIGVTFTLLSLICNHPHFIISYQIAYGRGAKFIRQNWLALIATPLALIALFALAYSQFTTAPASGVIVEHLNSFFALIGVDFRFGLQSSMGSELTSSLIWVMYLTVGWHYSKQVFGCMMVYGYFDKYHLSHSQKKILKASVFSVAILQFMFLYRSTVPSDTQQMTPIGVPASFYNFSIAVFVICFIATLIFVFAAKYRETKQIPSAGFLVPWIALHFWWLPLFQLPEYSILMVPFFHSLQYLPFAYRLGTPNFKKNRSYYLKISAHALAILVLGFFAFEGLPQWLDKASLPMEATPPMFFLTAFAVFINVHHFFIDSVVWRFGDEKVQSELLHRTP